MRKGFLSLMVLMAALAFAAGYFVGNPGEPFSEVSEPENVPVLAEQKIQPTSNAHLVPTPDAVEAEVRVETPPETVKSSVQSSKDSAAELSGQIDFMGLLNLNSDFEQTRALYVLLGDADSTEILGYLDQTRAIPRADDRRAAVSILLSRLSTVDPQAALNYATKARGVDRQRQLHGLFYEWSKFTPEAAVERIAQLGSPEDQEIALIAYVRAKLSLTMRELTLLLRQFPQVEPVRVVSTAIPQLAKSSPRESFQFITSLENSRARATGLHAWSNAIPIAFIEDALDMAEDIEQTMHRNSVFSNLFLRYGDADPVAALEKFKTGAYGGNGRQIVAPAIGAIAKNNPRQALELAMSLNPQEVQSSAAVAAIQVWVREDPIQAMQAIEQIEDAGLQRRVIRNSAYAFLADEDVNVMQWIERFRPYDSNIWQHALQTLSYTRPEQALEVFHAMPDSPLKEQMQTMVAGNIASNSIDKALELLKTIPAGAAYDQAATQVARRWIASEPENALVWILEQNESTQTQLLNNVASGFAREDLDLALAMADEIPASAQSNWIGGILEEYAKQRPEAAAGWLQQFSDFPEYQNWQTNLLSSVMSMDPKLGLRMLEDVQDPNVLRQVISSTRHGYGSGKIGDLGKWYQRLDPLQQSPELAATIAQNWYRSDPDGALRWVRNLDLSGERDEAAMRIAMQYANELSDMEKLLKIVESEDTRFSMVKVMLQNGRSLNQSETRRLIRSARVSSDLENALLDLQQQREDAG